MSLSRNARTDPGHFNLFFEPLQFAAIRLVRAFEQGSFLFVFACDETDSLIQRRAPPLYFFEHSVLNRE